MAIAAARPVHPINTTARAAPLRLITAAIVMIFAPPFSFFSFFFPLFSLKITPLHSHHSGVTVLREKLRYWE